MKKINNKGFILVETLVVTVFVMSIFSILYNNFYPLMSEFERREVYDNMDSKYGAYWVKRLIQEQSYDATNMKAAVSSSSKYYKFTCSDITNAQQQKLCVNLLDRMNVENAYITTYSLVDFKAAVEADPSGFSSNFIDYLIYLPEYSKVQSQNSAGYRVLVEFNHEIEAEDETGDNFYSYGTIEVKK